MPCESATGQCLSVPPPGRGCPGGANDCPVCCQPFNEVYGFNPQDTGGRFPGCFVGISHPQAGSIQTEIFRGHWCGHGCAGSTGDMFRCDDHELATIADSLDGKRWLAPGSGVNETNRDAHGMLHDLRSNSYHAVQPRSEWKRGTCWDNDRRECFGPDACSCWPVVRSAPEVMGDCNGAPVGEPLRGLLPDPMMRLGHGWPPVGVAGNVNRIAGGDTFYCRRFADARVPSSGETAPATVILFPQRTPAVKDLAEGAIGPVGASYSSCNGNILAYCSAKIEPPSPNADCGTSIWNDRPGDWYNNATDGSRGRFSQVRLTLGSNPPRILECDAATPLQLATAKLKNKVLEFVFRETFDGIRFDRLRNVQIDFPNAQLGSYARFWSSNDGPGRLVPGVYGDCRLAGSGCPVDVELRIKHVEFLGLIQVLYLRRTESLDPGNRWVEPHVRLLFVVELETTARLTEACRIKRYDGDTETVTLNGLNVEPPIDWIEFVDTEGSPVIPPRTVEWRGYLGAKSRPSATSRRAFVNPRVGQTLCSAVADTVRDIQVPGWPMLKDTRPESPAGIYAGEITIGFNP